MGNANVRELTTEQIDEKLLGLLKTRDIKVIDFIIEEGIYMNRKDVFKAFCKDYNKNIASFTFNQESSDVFNKTVSVFIEAVSDIDDQILDEYMESEYAIASTIFKFIERGYKMNKDGYVSYLRNMDKLNKCFSESLFIYYINNFDDINQEVVFYYINSLKEETFNENIFRQLVTKTGKNSLVDVELKRVLSEKTMLKILKIMFEEGLFKRIYDIINIINLYPDILKEVMDIGYIIEENLYSTFYNVVDKDSILNILNNEQYVKYLVHSYTEDEEVKELMKKRGIVIERDDKQRLILQKYLMNLSFYKNNFGYDIDGEKGSFNKELFDLYLGEVNDDFILSFEYFIQPFSLDEFKHIMSKVKIDFNLRKHDSDRSTIVHMQKDYQTAKYMFDNKLYVGKRDFRGLKDEDHLISVLHRKFIDVKREIEDFNKNSIVNNRKSIEELLLIEIELEPYVSIFEEYFY